MKKIFAVIICLVLVILSFCACQSAITEKETKGSETEEETQTENITEKEKLTEAQSSEENDNTKETESGSHAERITEPPAETEQDQEQYFYAEGSLRSDSGTYLNLRTDWSAESKNGKDYTIKLNVYLEHMSLFVSERYTELLIGGNSREYKIPAIHEEKDGTLFSDPVLSYEINTNAEAFEKGIDIKTSYPFRGVYGGKEIGTIVLEGTIK